jgi:hypothetical protein
MMFCHKQAGLAFALVSVFATAQSAGQNGTTTTSPGGGTTTTPIKNGGTTDPTNNGTANSGTTNNGTTNNGTTNNGTTNNGTTNNGSSTDESDCELPEVVATDLTDAYTRLRAKHTSLPKGAILQTELDTGFNNKFYIVVGPDGTQRGVTPSAVREDAELYVIAYRNSTVEMNVTTSGCERLQTRVLGGAAAVALAGSSAAEAEIYALGRCNADSQINIQIERKLVTGGTVKKCADKQIVLKTVPVYNLTVGYGAAYLSGTTTTTGVDLAAGGMPGTAFERESQRGLQDRVLLGWFPLGYSPDTRLFDDGWQLWEKIFVGTALDPSHALSSFNTVVGLSPVTGLAFFAGAEWCHKTDHLSGGVTNGAIYTDDSSTLPTTKSWGCDTEFIGGASVTADLLAKLFK